MPHQFKLNIVSSILTLGVFMFWLMSNDKAKDWHKTIVLRRKCPYSELFWSVCFRIRTEIVSEMFRISPYSVRMRENADQNNSEYGHFSHSVVLKIFEFKGVLTIS